MPRQLVFFKTEWMEFYDGRKGDRAPGRFGYVKRTGEAHEDRNFLRQGKYCYGYIPLRGPSGTSRIRLDVHFGADREAEYVDHVDVVFIAKAPDARGVVVVGWYEDARVYAELHQYKPGHYCHARVDAGNAHLIPVDRRFFRIDEPPRRANVWYADGRHSLIAAVRRLISGAEPAPRRARSKQDVPTRLRIEKAAYEAVTKQFEDLGYSVQPVWRDHVGWDLEVTRGGVKLLVEVKGTDGNEIRAELTPNEYLCSERDGYRICIVTEVLGKPTVHTFACNYDGRWFDESGVHLLAFQKRIAARLSVSKSA